MERKKEELLKEVEKLEDQIKQVKSSLDEVVKTVKGADDERIKTYINGFDEALEGGIEKKHVVLISGSAGTLKSTIALSILYNNVKVRGEKGVYLSLEEGKESLQKTMAVLNMNHINESELAIVDIGRMRLDNPETEDEKNWYRIIEEYLDKKVKRDGITLVAIDSLTALESLSIASNPRRELFHFFNRLRNLGLTVFLVTEQFTNGSSAGQTFEDYLSDGILNLKFHEGNGKVEWRIRCIKMRHSNHSLSYFTLLNKDGKFQAVPTNGHLEF